MSGTTSVPNRFITSNRTYECFLGLSLISTGVQGTIDGSCFADMDAGDTCIHQVVVRGLGGVSAASYLRIEESELVG